MRHYKKMFALSFLVVSGFAAYQWHLDLYRYHWTDAERKAYQEQTVKETIFQEKKFLQVLERLERDRAVYETDLEVGRDLFAGARKKAE